MAKIIYISGTSGSGKDSVHALLSRKLKDDKYEVIELKEPGPLENIIREYRNEPDKDPWVETALFTADRLILYKSSVFSRLEEPNLLFLSVRSVLDTFVYQGLMGGVDLEVIKRMNSVIPKPNLAICLTAKGNTAMQRIIARHKKGGEQPSKNETEEKINLLNNHYNSLQKYFPELNIELVDTTEFRSAQETFAQCYSLVQKVLWEN